VILIRLFRNALNPSVFKKDRLATRKRLSLLKRLALVGCGAVTELCYLPALKNVPECTVEWFVDSNRVNAMRVASKYGSGRISEDYHDAIDNVDGAIVAVPPYLHSVVSIDYLNAGRHVLCEKPIANNSKNAMDMIQASRQSSARLAVNLLRRRYHSYRTLKELLSRSLIGKIQRVNYQEGAELFWPFRSSYLLRKEKSGGGVLIDLGVHSIDTLRWLFGNDWTLLSYRDDGFGRIESNCVLDFTICWDQNRFPCHIELSYQRRLGKKMVIEGEGGLVRIEEVGETNRIHLELDGEDFVITGGDNAKSYVSYFEEQIRAFIKGDGDALLAGEDAIDSLRFIEECYRKRIDLTHSWEEYAAPRRSLPYRPHRILIVGASGFLGTRLAEVLSLEYGLNVRGTYHRPERATRLARLPIQLIECNILDCDQVEHAVEGCDVVVNCAFGKVESSGDARSAREVYVRGTRNLLEASKLFDVEKFIHLSTAAVCNFRQKKRMVDESCRYKFKFARNLYENGKISQEKLVAQFAESLKIVILRPTLIYGPYSVPCVVQVVDRLIEGKPTLVANGGLANLVYVDDVVDAIIQAIESDRAEATPFILNNDEDIAQWSDYVERFAKLMCTSPRIHPAVNPNILRIERLRALFLGSTVACVETLRSSEMLKLLGRLPLAPAVGSILVQAVKWRETAARLKYEMMPSMLYENLTCHTIFSAARAKASLAWQPKTGNIDGASKTLGWVEWAILGQE